MVVSGAEEKSSVPKDMRDLTFKSILKVDVNTKLPDSNTTRGKCSVDTDLALLGMESTRYFTCMDLATNELVFEQGISAFGAAKHCHNWIEVNGEKHVSIQTSPNTIQMFKVVKIE